MLKVLLIRIRGATITNALRRKKYWTILRVPCVRYTKVHTCRRLGRGTCTTTNTEKRCASPLSIGGDVKGKIAGKELATKEPQVDKGENSLSAPEKDEDGKHCLLPRNNKKCQVKKPHPRYRN